MMSEQGTIKQGPATKNSPEVSREIEFQARCNDLRRECKRLEGAVRDLHNFGWPYEGQPKFLGQHDEMKAHLMLAVRHLEDARMRLGKAIQYSGDGVSIFDKS